MGIDPSRLSERFFAPRPNATSLMETCATGQAEIGDVLPPILADLGYRGDLETFLRYWFEHDAWVDQALVDAVVLLRNRHGYECYLATSQEHRRAAFIWDELKAKDHFSGMYYSANLGLSKKSTDFYRAVQADFDFSGGRPIYFDDRESLVQVAAAAGWEACLYESIESLRRHHRIAAMQEP